MGNIQMKKETLYLDTSVPSAYFDDRTKERQEATIKFWREVLPLYQVYISGITVEELEATKNEFLRRNFKKLVKEFRILKVNKKIRNLTRIYIEKGIFPERYIDDALHVATASFYNVSYLLSWNFEHLVKVRTRRLVNSVNVLEGFSQIEIVSPQEL
jgi:predicted nucleic acid-binding protein